MYKVLERIILDRLMRHREETTRDDKAGFRPGRSTIDQTSEPISTAAVRTPAGCTTPFEVETGMRQGAVEEPLLFNFVVDDIMRRTDEQCPADVI
ncbi:hypothetical protein RB195_020269 [Necator americanus]|uniref:Reverse transcriptase domain-containing protein n=1 Tax=Necator americanus TaxID=51031 RepID=A0ABR1CI16_NECAM